MAYLMSARIGLEVRDDQLLDVGLRMPNAALSKSQQSVARSGVFAICANMLSFFHIMFNKKEQKMVIVSFSQKKKKKMRKNSMIIP